MCGWPVKDKYINIYLKAKLKDIKCKKCQALGGHWPRQ